MLNIGRHLLNILGSFLKLLTLPILLTLFSSFLEPVAVPVILQVISVLLVVFGVLGMLSSSLIMFRFGEGRLHFNRLPVRLVDIGHYARTRHPNFWFFLLYQAGLLILILGLQWLSLALWGSILVLGILWLKVVQEKILSRTLSPQYDAYRSETPFWFWKLSIPENKKARIMVQAVWVVTSTLFRYWYKIRVQGTEHIPHTKPFLVIANHECFLDPFLFGTYLPFEVRFVTTADVFSSPWMRFLLKGIGTFPMRRHRQDLKSIRTMIRMVNQGEVVGIFPEGGRSLYGAPLPILKETLKLIQRCGVPILPIHLDGAYEIWPRWAPNRRRGKVNVSIKPLIPTSQQSDLAQLERIIAENIFSKEKRFTSVKSSHMAKGLDNVLWACKDCRSLNTIKVRSASEIQCSACKKEWSVLHNYTLVDKISKTSCDMITWMRSIEQDMLDHAPELLVDFPLDSQERIFLSSTITQYVVETGEHRTDGLSLSLSDQRMILSKGQQIEVFWPLASITVFTMDYFNAVSIGVGGTRHSFFLPTAEVSLKWQTFYEKLDGKRLNDTQ